MHMTAEYLEEQGRCIVTDTRYAAGGGSPERYGALASFVEKNKTKNCKVLSVGCAGWDPVVTGATHALDVHPIAERLLRKHGWRGAFFLGDCRELPWPDKAFPVCYCSEVVEHLPTFGDVVRTFEELDRVCKSWLVSTPIDGMHVKFHRRDLTPEQVAHFCRKHGAKARAFSRWWWIWKSREDPEFTEVPRNEKVPRIVRRFIR
jgi:hypothetical protein